LNLVLDCSAFGPILLTDERHNILPGLQDALERSEVIVPVHWPIEVASAVQTAIRRGRMPAGAEIDAAATVAALPIAVDSKTAAALWSDTWRLAARHNLTIYDAAYLELSLRTGSALATHDAALLSAAAAESVELFGR